jgi:hypothetical protein
MPWEKSAGRAQRKRSFLTAGVGYASVCEQGNGFTALTYWLPAGWSAAWSPLCEAIFRLAKKMEAAHAISARNVIVRELIS